MSSDDLIRIKINKEKKYQVRHEFASSLIHELNGLKPTQDELLIQMVADNVPTKEEAIKIASKFESEQDIPVEYGIVDDNWEK